MSIARFEPTTEIGAVVKALQRDGAAVVTELAEPDLVETIRAELRPQFDARGLDTRSDFNGSHLRALLGYTAHGAGDDLVGKFRGECSAWVDTPPEAAWRNERGQVGTAADTEAQSGISTGDDA